jgi:hypothetical protein
MVKEEGNPGNLAALPTMMDFLDGSDRCEPPGRIQSTIMKHLENLSHYNLTEDSDGGNGCIFPPCTIDLLLYTDSTAKNTNDF